MYVKAAALTIEIPLFDSSNDPITSGAVTTEISKDSVAYVATTNSATHVDEELWTLALTTTETNCDRFRVRVTHADLAADVIVSDDAWPTLDVNTIEVGGVEVELISMGDGAYSGTLTVTDGAAGLEGATVNARRGGVLKATGVTDATGEIDDWLLGDATYDLTVRLAGYQSASDTVTVTDNDWTKTVTLTPIAITPPEAASLCTVQFRVKLSETAVSGAICKAKLLGINQASDGTILSTEEMSDTTDSNGIAELQLVQKGSIVKGSGLYKIWIEIAGKPVASVETTLPNQSTVLFEDLLKV